LNFNRRPAAETTLPRTSYVVQVSFKKRDSICQRTCEFFCKDTGALCQTTADSIYFLKNIEKTLILQTFPKSSMDKELEVRIEANRKEYERLLKDDDYTDVRFNPRNGALSAIHREHNFDPTIGIFGIPRGNYERISLDVLYDYGNCVILDNKLFKL